MEIKEEELIQLNEDLPSIPLRISLTYDERCNHACPSRRHEFFDASKEYKKDLKIITKNIEPYIGKVKYIATNGMGDLFVSHEILDMLSRFHPQDPEFYMFIETNGVLFERKLEQNKASCK